VSDADVLTEFRLAMSRDAGFISDADDVSELREATRRYMLERIGSEEFLCWIAEVDGAPAASAGVIVRSGPPNLRDTTGREAYLLNVYTLPEHRRKGLATALTERVLDWCASQGFRKLSLHATEDGARIYERLGFQEDSRAMILRR
jgi:GNAT superfamily N-acetyltransferase